MSAFFAKALINDNVRIEVVRNGKLLEVFQPYKWVQWFQKHGILPYTMPKIVNLFGYYSDHLEGSNLITSVGLAHTAGRLVGHGSLAAAQYAAVGIGTATPLAADTALQSEIIDSGLARMLGAVSRVTTDVTNDTAKISAEWNVTGTKSVTECGIFDASSSGNMIARHVFAAFPLLNGDIFRIIWQADVDTV